MRYVFLSVVMLACGGSSEPTESTTSTTGSEQVATSSVEEAPFGLMNGARSEPGVYTAGQPSGASIEAAHEGGVRTVISLRAEDEPGQEEELAAVQRLGMRFERVVVSGADDVTVENARRIDALMMEASNQGETLVHCGSGNRAGAMMALRAFFVMDLSIDDSLARGRAAGLASLEGRVREVIEAACAESPDDARCATTP